MAEVGDVIRIVYKGRPVFHGTLDPRTGQITSGGWDFDDTSPWTIQWDSRDYELTPGRDAFVPFEAAVSMFGDPRSGERIVSITDQHGRVGFLPDRATEVRRLRTKYNNMFGDETVIANHPVAEMYEMTGERLTTVLEDPQGKTVIPAATRTQQQDNELLAVVRKQQETINALMERVGIRSDGSLVNQETPAPPSPAAEPSAEPPAPSSAYPPEDDSVLAPSSEAATGERGGRHAGDPSLDWLSLNAEP